MKRSIISIILALTLCLGLTLPVLAATNEGIDAIGLGWITLNPPQERVLDISDNKYMESQYNAEVYLSRDYTAVNPVYVTIDKVYTIDDQYFKRVLLVADDASFVFSRDVTIEVMDPKDGNTWDFVAKANEACYLELGMAYYYDVKFEVIWKNDREELPVNTSWTINRVPSDRSFPDNYDPAYLRPISELEVSSGTAIDTTPAPAPAPAPAATPIATSTPQTVNPTTSTVSLNGAVKAFEAYNIGGNNYFKLRDLAFTLNGTEKQFAVGYDEATKAITLTGGQPYTAVGGEMAPGDGNAKTATPTPSKIYLNGNELNLTVYNIGGNNFFKLRDLMEAIDVYVGYDSATNAIALDTGRGYEAE